MGLQKVIIISFFVKLTWNPPLRALGWNKKEPKRKDLIKKKKKK